jgi:prepilin-type N-terminal cleavage/methylation domain-containing protein
MRRKNGFTLIEVVLVIAVITLIVAFIYPDLYRVLQARRMEESCDRLRSLLVMCRSRAMRDGIKYRIQFPGTPDPLDKNAEKEVDVPFETLQPQVLKQDRPIEFPDSFVQIDEDWTREPFMQDGVRCVAVLGGMPNFEEESNDSPFVGPTITEGKTGFVPLTFNSDGSCDWVTFVLTDLPFDVMPEIGDKMRIFNLIVDGRTGQSWFQRVICKQEAEILREHGASPVFHMDFKSPEMLTEANIYMLGPSPSERAAMKKAQPAQGK